MKHVASGFMPDETKIVIDEKNITSKNTSPQPSPEKRWKL